MLKITIITIIASTLLSGCFNNLKEKVTSEHDVLIYNANIVDVVTGKIRADSIIALNGNKITLIADNSALVDNKATKMLDAKNKYVIPGLWDMHVHFEGAELVKDNANLFPVYIAYGITTVRDSASDLGDQVIIWRDEINQGNLLGPQIYTAGRKLEGIDSIWKGDLEIGNEAELSQALDLLDQMDVDFVKMTANTLQTDLFITGIKQARKRGYLVSAHVPQKATSDSIIEAGVSSIEHASYMLRLGIPNEAELIKKVQLGEMSSADARAIYFNQFNQKLANTRYKELAEKNIAITPTLIGGKQLAYLDENDHKNDDFQKYLTSEFMSHYAWRINRMANDTSEIKQSRKDRYKLIASQVPYLVEAGVLILAGSDSAALNTFVYPAKALHEELVLFQEAGVKPLNILQAATINGAKFMGITDQTASITVNKEADLVILNTNPLEDIKATQNIFAVINNGKVFEREDIDKILNQAITQKLNLNLSRKTKP